MTKIKSRKSKISPKTKKVIKTPKVERISLKTPTVLLLLVIFIIAFVLNAISIFWLKAPLLIINKPQIKMVKKEPAWGEFLTFQGPNSFTFEYPNWAEIKISDLPPGSFPEGVKLLLMETDNQFMQFIALESLEDPTKDLKTLIDEDLKRESKKVRDLKVIKQEIGDKEAFLELTYFNDGFMARMLVREFLVKGEKENIVYSLAVQLVDSKLDQYKDISKRIIDSAKIVIQ